MRYFILTMSLSAFQILAFGQERVSPVIKSTGAIYKIPEAVEKPDPSLHYRIVVDLQTADGGESQVTYAMNNLARMINLHAVGGVDGLEVVGVVHSTNTRSILTDEAYMKRYGVPNPNTALIKELVDKGVKIFVCGQSLRARNVDPSEVMAEVGFATAALTVLTTYQLRGFAALRF